MNTSRAILRLLSLLLLAGCNPPPAAVKQQSESTPTPAVRLVVADTARSEWGPLYTLDDGQTTLQVAPSIGRVMHLSRSGEANLLWTSNDPARDRFGAWTGFGGEKLWPWPQKPAWDWPPPLAIDTGPYRCEVASDHAKGLRWIGPVDPASGLAGSRVTWLENGVVCSRYALERRSPSLAPTPSRRVAAWAVAQVPPVDVVYVRLLPGQPPIVPAVDIGQPLETRRLNDRWLKVTPKYTGTKLCVPGDLIAVPICDRLLVFERVEGNEDAILDRANAAQLYFHRAPKGSTTVDASVFAELELIGPSRVLAEGESCSLSTRCQILSADQLPDLLNADNQKGALAGYSGR